MLLAQQDNRPLIQFTSAPLFEDHGIALAVMGVFVVFMALVLVVAFITVLPRVLAMFTETQLDQSASLPAADDAGLSEEMRVVIAAAVAETIRAPHRIVRIRGLTPEDLGWSLEGRTQHHQSHRIHHRGRR